MDYVKRLLLALVVLSIYVAVPLLGWGYDDLEGFFTNPARLLYIVGSCLAIASALTLYRFIPRATSKGIEEKRVSHQTWLLRLMRIPSLSFFLVAPYCDRRAILIMEGGDALRYAGLAMYVAGFAFAMWSTLVLGKQFSVHVTIQEDHELVTSGPYRFIRHPRYLGLILFVLGVVLIFRSWIGLALSSLFIFIILTRVADEDALLNREFKEHWESYRQRTWRLVPFVY